MNWYKNHYIEWKEVVETVSREIKKAEILVEKDTIQSMFLKELSKVNLPFVFKGGTSLSKAYNLINRFSEDIDLSMQKKPTQTEKKKSKDEIIRIADSMGMILVNPDNIKSRHDYNKYRFNYNSVFSDVPQEIIIETSYYQNSFPVEKHKISSFVGQFCVENRLQLSIPFEAANTEINVQSIERTFIDKVFAICDYYIQDMQDRDSRHLYDICKLLPFVKLDQNLNDLINEVRRDRMLSKNNPSAQLQYNIPNMLKEIIQNKFYEPDYRFITKKLLYEDISYDYVIENGIALIADSDVFLLNN